LYGAFVALDQLGVRGEVGNAGKPEKVRLLELAQGLDSQRAALLLKRRNARAIDHSITIEMHIA